MPVLVRTLIFTIFVPGTVAGLLPWLVVSSGPGLLPLDGRLDLGPWRHAGWLLIAAGAAGYLRCALDFAFRGHGTPFPLDAPRRFVATGPYRYVRNPMYVSVGTAIAGEVCVYQAPILLVYVVVFWALVHAFVLLYEEPALRRKFGTEYEEYLRRVPRWLPRLTSMKP